MKIKVTKKHIRKGERISIFYCPVALALKERVHKYVTVYTDSLEYYPYVNGNTARRIVKTPVEVKRFISDFDCQKKVKPFNFEVSFKERR